MPELSAPGQMPTPPATVPTGPTGPATVPPQMDGRMMRGRVQVTMALNALEKAASEMGGSQSEDGREILGAVLKLRKRFGGAAADLQRQEVKMMGQQVPPVQQPTPQEGQNFQQAAQKMQAAQGMGAAA